MRVGTVAVARALEMAPQTITRLARAGRIPGARQAPLSGRWTFDPRAASDWAAPLIEARRAAQEAAE